MKITTIEDLEALYQPAPKIASTAKEVDYLTSDYRKLVEASPFVALATVGPEGLDCSPRGESGGVVRIVDDRTLMMPDRRGNNRIDSLRNIVRDPRVALLFLIPGSSTAFRVNGTAEIITNNDVLESFAVGGKPPRSVIVVRIGSAYFQCARAIIRAGLWQNSPLQALPTVGTMLESLSQGAISAVSYDEEWPGRAEKTMW
jgi:uncharacterized protein